MACWQQSLSADQVTPNARKKSALLCCSQSISLKYINLSLSNQAFCKSRMTYFALSLCTMYTLCATGPCSQPAVALTWIWSTFLYFYALQRLWP